MIIWVCFLTLWQTHSLSIYQPETSHLQCVWMGWLAVLTVASYIERMVVRALSLDVRPIACSCKKSCDKVITRAILSHPRTTLSPAAYWRKTVRKILCVCFVQGSLSDALDRACSVRPYFYLRLFLRMHSDQTEFCVSYDFLIASSRAPIVKAP